MMTEGGDGKEATGGREGGVGQQPGGGGGGGKSPGSPLEGGLLAPPGLPCTH